MKSLPHSDFDPGGVAVAYEMACLYFKTRPRRFRAFIDQMMDLLGLTLEQAQPYARNAYNQIRGDMELNGDDVTDVDSAFEVIAEICRMRAADEARRLMYMRYVDDELTAKERDTAMETLDHSITDEAIRAVTNARQVVLQRYDDGELTAAELEAEMDALDNQIVQLAIRIAKKARKAVLTQDDNGELTFAERAVALGVIDSRFALLFHAGATPPQGPTRPKSEPMPKSASACTGAGDTIEVNDDGFLRLQSAVTDFARAEATRIVQAVIADLRDRPAQGMFGEVAARHMWDEYSWSLQEGPFDDDMGWDDVSLGSMSGAFDEMVRAVIEAEIEKLPHHAQVFLSAKAIEDDLDMEEDALGSSWMDGMVSLIVESVNSEASGRNLDLIGPERGDVIGYEIDGSGTVWSVLSDRSEAMDIVQSHVDELIDPNGDLSALAAEMVDAYIAAAREEADGTTLSEFFDNFENQIRDMLTERDVFPALEDMRAGLLERLDG